MDLREHMRGVIRQGMSSLRRWLAWPRTWRQPKDESLDGLREILERLIREKNAFLFQVPGRRMIRLSFEELRDPANNPWRQNADPVAHPTVMQTAPANDNPKEGAGVTAGKSQDEDDKVSHPETKKEPRHGGNPGTWDAAKDTKKLLRHKERERSDYHHEIRSPNHRRKPRPIKRDPFRKGVREEDS